MDIHEAILKRHSVRQYLDKDIEEDKIKRIESLIAEANEEAGLHIQLVVNEPKAFKSFLAHYGRFRGVKTYIVMAGKKDETFDERCGYYGEKIVLEAQMMGLNTCWVALTYKKVPGVFTLNEGEKINTVITLGYGENQGEQHRSRKITDVSNVTIDSPDWFKKGVDAALYAPTAVNQQKFYITQIGDQAEIKPGRGPNVRTDLGIVRYHFEVGSGRGSDVWV